MIDPESPDIEESDDGIEVSGPEEEYEDKFEHDYNFASEEVETPRKGLGLFPVLGISLLAVIVATLGGAYGAQYLTPPADLVALKTDIQKDMSDFRQDISQINTEMTSSMNEFKKELDIMQDEIERATSEDLQPALAEMKEQLVALEKTPQPGLSEIDPKTINMLKAAQKDGFKWPETGAMETDITALKTANESLKSNIDALNTQVTSIEKKLEEATLMSQPAKVETASIRPVGPTFPKQTLLNAAKTKADSQGLLARTLNKHVHVERPDSPKNLINDIETAYDKGDVYTAIKTFDRLPSDIRIAGQDWRDAADRLK